MKIRPGLGLLTFILVVFSSGVLQAQNWRQFVSEPGRYRIEMPDAPKFLTQALTHKNGRSSDLHVAFAEADNKRFMIAYVDYPEVITDRKAAEAVLEGFIEGAASGRELRRRHKISIAGNDGVEFLVVDATGLVALGRVVVIGSRTYQIAVSGPSGAEQASHAKRFLDSFVVLTR